MTESRYWKTLDKKRQPIPQSAEDSREKNKTEGRFNHDITPGGHWITENFLLKVKKGKVGKTVKKQQERERKEKATITNRINTHHAYTDQHLVSTPAAIRTFRRSKDVSYPVRRAAAAVSCR